jgi:hypothetical protein
LGTTIAIQIIQGTKASISVVTGNAIFANGNQSVIKNMATTTAMVMLALAPWAVRHQLRLFSLLTHHPRYQGKYICCHGHCHFCK